MFLNGVPGARFAAHATRCGRAHSDQGRRSSRPQTKRRSRHTGSSYAAAARSASCGSATLSSGSRRRSRPRFCISSTLKRAGRPARSSRRTAPAFLEAASSVLLLRRSPAGRGWGPRLLLCLLWAAAPWAAASMASFGQPRWSILPSLLCTDGRRGRRAFEIEGSL